MKGIRSLRMENNGEMAGERGHIYAWARNSWGFYAASLLSQRTGEDYPP